MQVKDMTTDELKALIQDTVEEALQQFFDDPDAGKEVREEVKQELYRVTKAKTSGRTRDFD